MNHGQDRAENCIHLALGQLAAASHHRRQLPPTAFDDGLPRGDVAQTVGADVSAPTRIDCLHVRLFSPQPPRPSVTCRRRRPISSRARVGIRAAVNFVLSLSGCFRSETLCKFTAVLEMRVAGAVEKPMARRVRVAILLEYVTTTVVALT